MRIKIYQIDMDRDDERIAFESLDNLKRYTGRAVVKREIYDMAYECEVGEDVTLEDIYCTFNMNHPEDYRARSISVSDVVETPAGLFFCDSFGWKKIEWDKEVAA